MGLRVVGIVWWALLALAWPGLFRCGGSRGGSTREGRALAEDGLHVALGAVVAGEALAEAGVVVAETTAGAVFLIFFKIYFP